MYESELTKFLREFLQSHPEELEVRRKGRALWWDRPQDPETQRNAREARVAQKPYCYQPD